LRLAPPSAGLYLARIGSTGHFDWVPSKFQFLLKKAARYAKRFAPGSVVATPGALEALRASGDDPLVLLSRHLNSDWGDVDEHDRRENELSVRCGWRILSCYRLNSGIRIWLITEADRRATTFLLPEEY